MGWWHTVTGDSPGGRCLLWLHGRCCAGAARAADLPAELKYVPPDAAAFLYLDVAALYEGKLGETLKKTKSAEVITTLAPLAKQAGLTLADLKVVVVAVPSMQEPTGFAKTLSVATYRKKYDREKLVAAIRESNKGPKTEVVVTENVVRITSPSPFNPDGKITVTHDLTDDTRIVSLNGLGDEYLKPTAGVGCHTAALKANATAPALAGLNLNAMPAEFRTQELPPEMKPFRPIVMADGLFASGVIADGKLTVALAVKAKTKGEAAEVEKSLDAGRVLLNTLIDTTRKGLVENYERPKELGGLFDALQAGMKGAKFALTDSTATASMSLPTDAPLDPLFDVFTGGGLSGRQVSSNNLKQIALAFHNHQSAHQFFPPPASLGKKGKKLLSWRVAILPYVEHDALYKQFKLDEPWDSEHNLKVMKDNPMPKVFALPGSTDEQDKKTHYQVFVGNGAGFEPTGPTKITDYTDGTSNTILVATAAKAVEWTRPDDIEFDPKAEVAKLLLFQNKVCLIAFADGSVRAISEKVSDQSLKALITRNGGEVVSDD
ncbi:MAG: DUF1559 domain-containing protein [Fimbriiglobus sp.]|nr:DUF1559 domain-containing protein [Fimbriiglobus sp.]